MSMIYIVRTWAIPKFDLDWIHQLLKKRKTRSPMKTNDRLEKGVRSWREKVNTTQVDSIRDGFDFHE